MKTIAILTDFGLSDNFVGVIKGVILKINPRVRLVDISHEICAHDTFQAAFLLKSSYRYFPKGTIFLVVVDPGVGSKRYPIIIRTKNYLFVGPDNGCLSLAACADGIEKIVVIENERYFLKPISFTFHGRDIFAPTAAHLSKGRDLNLFGRAVNSIKQLCIARPRVNKNILKGEIIYIDKFGNLITNIEEDLFRHFIRNKKFRILIKNTEIDSVVCSYQKVKPGEPLAIFGSFGFLEISINRGNARKFFLAKKGLAVSVHRR